MSKHAERFLEARIAGLRSEQRLVSGVSGSSGTGRTVSSGSDISDVVGERLKTAAKRTFGLGRSLYLNDRGGEVSAAHETAPDELATIVYTSGTTGRPKGVMLSHRNILWNVEAQLKTVLTYHDDTFLSSLPLIHAFERTVGYYFPMIAGSCVAYARSLQQLGEYLKIIRPTVLISVPRVYEKAYAKIQTKLAAEGRLPRVVIERIAGLLQDLPAHAQVNGVRLLSEPWSIDNGLLTPTMKAKRGEVERRFAGEIRELYAGHVMTA